MDRNAIKEIWKKHKGRAYAFPIGVLARNVETDSEHRFLTDATIQEIEDKLRPGSPINGNTVTFTSATTRTELESGDTASTLFGKIKKWLNDLRTAAFCDATESLDVTTPGFVVDGRTAKKINDKFGGLRFYEDASGGKYVVGADSVPKKLGSVNQGEWQVVAEEWFGDNSGLPGQHSGSQGNFVGKQGGYVMESSGWRYVLAKDYDIKTLRGDYAQLTADDFICVVTTFLYDNVNCAHEGNRYDLAGPSVHVYDAVAGKLTVKSECYFTSGPNHGECVSVKVKTMICA